MTDAVRRALGVALLELRGVVREASLPAASAWLARCAGVDVGELPGPSTAAVDDVLDAAWRGPTPEGVYGRVYTPREVARQLLLESSFPDAHAATGHLVDPACGGGIFLLVSAELRRDALRGAGLSARQVALRLLETTHGLDLDPDAVTLARLLLGLEVARGLGRAGPDVFDALPLPSVHQGDAMDRATAERLRHVTGLLGPRWVVGNPPYLEAKRMPKALRDAVRARFPHRLKGAWDLYMAFLELSLELVAEGGTVGLVLPNKFLVARYGEAARARLLHEGWLRAVVDMAELDVFRKVGVYPVLVVLRRGEPALRSVWRVGPDVELGRAPLTATPVPYALLQAVADPPVVFTLPDGPLGAMAGRLVRTHPRLGDQVEVRSTVSFHVTGMRERYVRPGAELADGLPYLGGRSYARRNEVRPFRIRWAGFRIRYDREALAAEGNPVPPPELFQRPKVVYCQHARSLVAAADPQGRYVTKDVFPVALPQRPTAQAAFALAALLNSRLLSTLYSLFFRGIQVGGRTLHFLPVYLRRLPLPELSLDDELDLAAAGRAVAGDEPGAQDGLDALVARLYGLAEAEAAAVRGYADAWLEFDRGAERS